MSHSGEALQGAALLSVDGAGQSLLVVRRALTLGHLRSGRAEIGLVADLGSRHAELVPTESLGAGPGWTIAPLEDEPVHLDGLRLAGPRRLVHGDRLRLGQNLTLSYTTPDITSESALLCLERGAECYGAQRLVLFAPGRGGRLRLGAAAERHLRVPNLEIEVELELSLDGKELFVRVGPAPGLDRPRESHRFPFPPRRRIDLACGPPRGSRPPFGLSLEPVTRPFPA